MAQIKIVNTVIAIVLQRKPDSVITPLRRVIIITNIGGKLLMVVLCEIAPVMKGKKALPACPNPAIQPIEPAPLWQDTGCLVHCNWVPRREDKSKERRCNSTTDDGWNKPYGEL